MGGLVARYGLAKTVKEGGNPQVSTLATYDSPHRGLNIPLGFQAALRQCDEAYIFPFVPLSATNPRVKQGLKIYDSQAGRQMMTVRATNGTGGIEYNTFIEGEYRQMITGFVMPYKFVTLSAGAECAQRNANPFDTFMEAEFTYGQGNNFITDMMGLTGLIPDLIAQLAPYIGNGEGLFTWDITTNIKAIPNIGSPEREIARLKIRINLVFLENLLTDAIMNYLMPIPPTPAVRKLRDKIFRWLVKKIVGTIVSAIAKLLPPMYDKGYSAPSNLLPLDGVAGSTKASRELFHFEYAPRAASFVPPSIPQSVSYPVENATFVAVPSALDVEINQETIYRAYNSGYLGTTNSSQTNKFLTQEPSNGSGILYNRPHDISPTARMGLFLYREIENQAQSNADICQRACPPSVVGVIFDKNELCADEVAEVFTASPIDLPLELEVSEGLEWWQDPATLKYYIRNILPADKSLMGQVTAVYTTPAGCKVRFQYKSIVWLGKPKTPIKFVSNALEAADGKLVLCPNENYTLSIYAENEWDILEFEHNDAYCVNIGASFKQGNYFYMQLTAPAWGGCYDYLHFRARNKCGWGPYRLLQIEVKENCSGGGFNPCGIDRNGLGRPCDHLGFTVYENPFHNQFRVRVDGIDTVDYFNIDDNTLAGFQYEIRVYDRQGMLKRQMMSDKAQTLIDMQNLPADTYYVTVLFGGGAHTVSKQAIKQ
jgi:hypothetical protein